MPFAPRLPFFVLLLLTGISAFSLAAPAAELDCDHLENRVLRELSSFVADRAAITDRCLLNARAPANNRVPGFAQGGICERTYKFMNGFVLETRKKLEAACAALGPREGCAPQGSTGQASCLRAAGARFEKASRELAAARDLLASAEKKMDEQREQNKLVGLAYAENLTRIKQALGTTNPRVLGLARHEPTGADSLRNEGLASLREVLEKSQISENTRAIENRASQITGSFTTGSAVAAEALGPFAGEQLAAFRRAVSFASTARRVRPELALVAGTLEGNGRRALASAERLEKGDPAPPKDPPKAPEKTAGPVSLPPVAPLAGAAPAAARGPGRRPSSRSDLQLVQKAAELVTAAGALGQPEAAAKPGELAKNSAAPAEAEAATKAEASEKAPAASASEAPAAPVLPTHEEKIVRWGVAGAPVAEESSAKESAPPMRVFVSASAEVSTAPGLASSSAPPALRRPAAGALEEAVIPNLAPEEPVVPEGGPLSSSLASPREYSLRDQLRARLKEEERARTNSTLATQKDPDAPLGSQDLRYDRRLTNLSPDEAAFSEEEREMREALRGLTSAHPPSVLDEMGEIGGLDGAPLFERVRLAHKRFQRR